MIIDEGFPEEPMMFENDPREEMRFFLIMWRNIGDDRRMTVVGIDKLPEKLKKIREEEVADG